MNFIDVMEFVAETYDTVYGVGEREMVLPRTKEDLEEAWFTCPECGEPIYYSDWEGCSFTYCPICEFEFEQD